MDGKIDVVSEQCADERRTQQAADPWILGYDTARDLIALMKIVQGAPVRSVDGTAVQGVEWYRRKAIGLRELVGTPFEGGGRRADEAKVEGSQGVGDA